MRCMQSWLITGTITWNPYDHADEIEVTAESDFLWRSLATDVVHIREPMPMCPERVHSQLVPFCIITTLLSQHAHS